jgi:dCTP deaminase
MIMSDHTLKAMDPHLLDPWTPEHMNPASIDICIGRNALYDDGRALELLPFSIEQNGEIVVQPLEFVLIETYESLHVPDWCAVELRLKSSIARMGFNHSLAFWFDPGWNGIGTMEIFNQRSVPLTLRYMQRFAQVIVHRLDGPCDNPYRGRYQGAQAVEAAKP